MTHSRKLLSQNLEVPECFFAAGRVCIWRINDHLMGTNYFRSFPKCSFLTGIIFSLYFLQEGDWDQNGDCILCFSCNLYDDVIFCHFHPPSQHKLSTIYGPHVVEAVDFILDCMHCSYLLNKPYCSVKPISAWKWICYAKLIPDRHVLRSNFLFS